MNNKIKLAFSLLVGVLVSGCNGSSSDDTPVIETGTNLTISEIQANNLRTYEMGQTLVVDYVLEAQEAAGMDVVVDFYLVHSESDNAEGDQELEITETHFLSSITHAAVEDGSSIEAFDVEIPSVSISGDYWIVAIVDPNDDIAEINEDDNHPSIDNEDHVNGDFPAVEIDVLAPPEHDFDVVSAYIDDGVVVLDSPEVHAGTGEHHTDIIGHMDAIYHGPHSATAYLSAEVLINGNYQAVELWDAASADYVMNQPIDFAYNGDEHFFGFDVALSDAQLALLYESYDAESQDNELTIRMSLEDTTATTDDDEHTEHNNDVVLTVPLFFFERVDEETSTVSNTENSDWVDSKDIEFTGNKLTVDGSYDKGYGDQSKFRVGVELAGELQVDLLDKAASLEAGGSVDMWVFNAHNTIFGVSFDGQAYVTGLNTGYDSEMIIFNTTVYEDAYWNAQFEKTFEKSWEEERILAQAKFTVGPIPITVSAGIEGGVGFELTLGYALSELYSEGDIFSANFGGFATGGVDLGLVAGGVIVQINILDNVLALESSAELALLEDGVVNPRVDYSFLLTDDIDAISGQFGLYADVRSIKWCKKFFIPYPCGIKTNTFYLWLYQTPSVFEKQWVILSAEDSISI